MILVTPKYPDIHPFAFKETDGEKEIPWGHLQIIGGRQLVAFDNENHIIGCVDLVLTKDVKIIRLDGITSSEVSDDGGTVSVRYKNPKQPIPLPPSSLDPRQAVAGEVNQGQGTYGNRRFNGPRPTLHRAVTQGDGYGWDPDHDDPDDHIERDQN